VAFEGRALVPQPRETITTLRAADPRPTRCGAALRAPAPAARAGL